MGPLSIEEVLAAEADAIHGESWRAGITLRGQDAQQQRDWLNADDRDTGGLPDGEAERRAKLYRALNKLNRAALCCSGGGIRSATFCLGVIQALADHHTCATPKPDNSAKSDAHSPSPGAALPGGTSSRAAASRKPEDSLLGCFDYLSTVSGGGYVGSWLSSWRARQSFAAVIRNLTTRPDGADIEPPEISWLRAYSNYLTPRLGIASADSWAALAICVRNLILNWLVIIPAVCVALLFLKVIATGGLWIARGIDNDKLLIPILVAGVLCFVAAQWFTNRHRPSRRGDNGNVNEIQFLLRDFLLAYASAILLTVFFTSHYFSTHFLTAPDAAANWVGLLLWLPLAAFCIYLIGWISAGRLRRTWPDLICWPISGLVYGALVGVGASLFHWFKPYVNWPNPEPHEWYLLAPIIFGVPWVLMAQLVADNIFIGLSSYEIGSDSDREWLGRAAGWLAAGAIAWALTAFLVFAGEYFVQWLWAHGHRWIVASGGVVGVISGITSALLGSSSKTPAKSNSDAKYSKKDIALAAVLALAGPLFAAALIVALSIGLDRLLLGGSLVDKLHATKPVTDSLWPILKPLLIGTAVTMAVAAGASWLVNINRFSLHALYRNRLIRAYLGASRQVRHPDLFTGFDVEDNVRMHELWPPLPAADGTNSRSLFHVINIALNVVATKRKAWQQRKAEPFTVTPLHCGSAYLGYRYSHIYGDGLHAEEYFAAQAKKHPAGNHRDGEKREEKERRKFGITLGTAMAISGAAVSPNMGYHSSPSITLLLTLFNVRLGWWLGNPGERGSKTYKEEGPAFAFMPLFEEAFGQTTDQRRYVYLSDGGHFENLGLYEMVRRRCRLIIVVDAGCDPKFAFEDLGNALRKIYIDLGVRIRFTNLQDLHNRPSPELIQQIPGGAAGIPYCATGTIFYQDADGREPGCADGRILYIKPAYHGTEGAGIRSYAAANPTFPHESTVDQWFTESQFESYRSLGLDVANHTFNEQQEIRSILNEFLRNRTPARELLPHQPQL